MEKTELPTSSRLDELRSQGYVPYSTFATRAAATIGALGALLAMKWRYHQLAGHVKEVLSNWTLSDKAVPVELLRHVLDDITVIVLTSSVAALVAASTIGLFQTRFMLRIPQVVPSFDRLNPFRAPDLAKLLREISLGLLSLLLVSFIAALLTQIIFPDLVALLNLDRRYLAGQIFRLASAVVPMAVPCLGFAGFFSYLLARRHFMHRHMMTREEVRQEGDGR